MNKITQHNPYGATTEKDVVAFEESIGYRLPVSYRQYLLSSNGGKFENYFFHAISFGQSEIHPIHVYFRLGAAPEFARLENMYPFSQFHDLDGFSEEFKKYLCFADNHYGDDLLMDLERGTIYFYRSDDDGDKDSFGDLEIVKVAPNFRDFVDNMISKKEAWRLSD
ncbi:SMI1/KNR4 family protein [Thalassobius sp. MITS945101]|uniref:SMI1/KNR4 family protein n=1 Tax=Thalassobius sp. MITS945101 TaxID=3096994 RepID=UPI00399C093E